MYLPKSMKSLCRATNWLGYTLLHKFMNKCIKWVIYLIYLEIWFPCIIVGRRWWRLYINTTKGLLCVQVTHYLPCVEKHAVFMASRSCVSPKIQINFSKFCVICTSSIESESQCKIQAVWLILEPLLCSCRSLHKDLNNPVEGHTTFLWR